MTNTNIARLQGGHKFELGGYDGAPVEVDWKDVLQAFASGGARNVVGVWDDFIGAALDTNLWTVDAASTGTGAYGTLQVGGAVRLTTAAAAANDHVTLAGDTLLSPTRLSAIWRAKLSAITERAVELGVSDAASETAGLAFSSVTTPTAVATDALVFGYNSGQSANWYALAVVNDVAVTYDTGIVADDEWHEFQILVTPAGAARYYIDNTLVATHEGAVRAAAVFRAWATNVTLGTASAELQADFSGILSGRL